MNGQVIRHAGRYRPVVTGNDGTTWIGLPCPTRLDAIDRISAMAQAIAAITQIVAAEFARDDVSIN